jgi:hypothetical protein
MGLADEELSQGRTRMSDRDIYEILESLDAAQRGVKQLPALFKPANTSPQLNGPYPGRNATRGYMVGEETGKDVESLIDRYINLDYQSREGYGEEGEDAAEYFERINDEMDVIEEKIRAQFGDDAARRLLKHAYEVNYGGIDPDQATKIIENKRYDHENPMARAVHIRIINQHPEWIIKYGVEELMQAIEDVVGDDDDWEEIGSSDVSAFVEMVRDRLRDTQGSREEMDRRRPFAEDDEPTHRDGRDDDEEEIDDDGRTMADRARRDGRGGDDQDDQPETAAQRRRRSLQATRDFNRGRRSDQMRESGVAEGINFYDRFGHDIMPQDKKKKPRSKGEGKRHISPSGVKTNMDPSDDDYEINYGRDGLAGKIKESLRAGEYHLATVTLDDGSTHEIKIRSDEGFREPIERHFARQGRKVTDIDVDYSVRSDMYEGRDTATEDVLSTMKKKLGDYLQDVATAIKKDPDLVDQIPGEVDQIRAVKTIKTDDGHEIKIHGTEDDGFRISIKNKNLKTEFQDLDEAVMAAEMYCARRRRQALEADYIDEKTS